jgi:putative addiction module component (TIGR02574 family)
MYFNKKTAMFVPHSSKLLLNTSSAMYFLIAYSSSCCGPAANKVLTLAMPKPKLSDILDLSVAERIELVQDIWDSIAEMPEEIVLTEEQKRELDRRSTDLKSDPNSGIPWEQVKASLRL